MPNTWIMANSVYRLGTPVATSTDSSTEFNVLNIRDRKTGKKHKFASAATGSYTVDCGTAKPADTLFIRRHNYFTASASILVQYSSDNFAADIHDAFVAFAAASDFQIIKKFVEASARYWRVTIQNPTVAAWVGVIELGQRLEFPVTPDVRFDPIGEDIQGSVNRSRLGEGLGAVVEYFPRRLNARFGKLSRSFVMDSLKPLYDAELRHLNPFIFSWNDDDPYNSVILGTLPIKSRFSTPLNVLEVVRDFNLQVEGVVEFYGDGA